MDSRYNLPPWERSGFSQEDIAQKERLRRIEPFWNDLMNNRAVKGTKNHLYTLLKDLKEEGNALFKKQKYTEAWLNYRNALVIAKQLEAEHSEDVDRDVVSALFSNRAFCCIKLERYDEAVSDSDLALEINQKNIKAFYRKAIALKGMKEYSKAREVAQIGLVRAGQNKDFIKGFEDLIADLDRKTTISASLAQSRGAANVDHTWLQGTNAFVPKKTEQPKKKKPEKKKKQESQPVRHMVKQLLSEDEDEDDEEEEEEEESEEEVVAVPTIHNGNRYNILANVGEDMPKTKKQSTSGTKPKNSGDSDANNMGLDHFSGAPLKKSNQPDVYNGNTETPLHHMPKQGFQQPQNQHQQPYYQQQSQQFQHQQYQYQDQNWQYRQHEQQHHQQQQYHHQHQQYRQQHQQPFFKSYPPPSSHLPPAPLLPEPYHTEYEHMFACPVCFEKVGEGMYGYKLWTLPNHRCMENVLLFRLKKPQAIWIRIRPRPTSVNFVGTYKLCQQFTSDIPCRVGDGRCTFAHNVEEIDLWQKDREGTFSISDFIRIHIAHVEKHQQQMAQASAMFAHPHNQMQPQFFGHDQMGTPGPYRMSSPKRFSQGNMPVRPPTMHPQGHHLEGPPIQEMKPPLLGHGPPNARPVPNQYQRFSYIQDMQNRVAQGGPGGKGGQMEVSEGGKLAFPLAHTHNFILACVECLQNAGQLGLYKLAVPSGHICDENVLAVQKKGTGSYVIVRERHQHRPFSGKYQLCTHYTGTNPQPCRVGTEQCSFAHNEEEQILWTRDKDGVFNIVEFILQHKSKDNRSTVLELMKKYGGQFKFICTSCFYSRPPRISPFMQDTPHCNGPGKHTWEDNKLLIHVTAAGITTVSTRKFTGKQAYFKFCYLKQFCQRQKENDCYFAHSMVERDVWLLERDAEVTQEDIVMESERIVKEGSQSGSRVASSSASTATSGSSTPRPESPEYKENLKCAFKISFLCGLCWNQGKRSIKIKDKDRCSGSGVGHAWESNKIAMLLNTKCTVRPLPSKIPAGLRFQICKRIQQYKKCDLGKACTFPHTDDEMEVWKWLAANRVSTLEELVEMSNKAQEEEVAKSKIVRGQTSITVKASAKPSSVAIPLDITKNIHYCRYCGVQCNSSKQWDAHCTSDRHTFNVNADREHQWNYRQPPWGVANGEYQVCEKHIAEGSCRYSNMPDMYNSCQFAHSQEELDEWKERFEWRQMKREMAKQEKVFSYMDELLEKYEKADSGITVLTEDVHGIDIKCTDTLSQYKQEKKANHEWNFDIKGPKELVKVALLFNKDRLHFNLQGEDLYKNCQVSDGDSFKIGTTDSGHHVYRVTVQFVGGMFGSFSQWVVLDFGSDPVLVRKMNVEVGTREVHEKVKELREKLQFDRWTSDNREIVRYDRVDPDSFSAMVMRQYKEPSSADAVITQDSVVKELNRHNYAHKMHKMLQVEELTRHNIIAEFDLQTCVELTDCIKEDTHIFARPGELFARVPLNEQLSEDTNAGKLVLTSVTHVLLAPQNSTSKRVYEATLVQKENFDYDGRGRDYIYLCLTPQCCEELNYRAGTRANIEIQFQMGRLLFCFMHFAIDHLTNTDLVFPDVTKINPVWNVTHNFEFDSQVLNEDQMKVVKHIGAERTGNSPPLIVYGPFGTGKTETLAQAAMVIINARKDAKILLCTHSNSAADLYILRHLGPYVMKQPNVKMCRVYYKDRRVNTVHPDVQKYCLLASDRSTFLDPKESDIRGHQVVILTLTSSLLLTRLNLQGYFTHILIDEGGQALECETIMPMTLATETTCIVIAGDHMQMSPKVYSPEARSQQFHKSFLERLYRHYQKYSKQSDCGDLNVLLSNNYRSKMEILRFISAIFYGGPDRLIAKSNILDVHGILPLTFYVAQGHEVQDADSTSYYNTAEIDELVDQVEELWNRWPPEWGERTGEAIGVVTPYVDQVTKIRAALRKKNSELRDVVVERVMNVQGKEFRALFISTVRTRRLVEMKGTRLDVECDGDSDDFGFLSDQKLLNTALTRAQSLVAVVGDPVALCALGDCMVVWRTFLKHCQNMGSIHPSSVTLESVRTSVMNLMNSEVMTQFRTNRVQHSITPSTPAAVSTVTPLEQQRHTPNVTQPQLETAEVVHDIYDNTGSQPLLMSEIMKCLGRESLKHTLEALPSNLRSYLAGMPLKLEYVKIMAQAEYVCVDYVAPVILEAKGLNQIEEQTPSSTSQEYSVDQLKELLKQQPQKYKLCVLIQNNGQVFGEVLNDHSFSKMIMVTSCGPAFNSDEVVVELADVHNPYGGNSMYGKVIGVVQHAFDPRSQHIVCSVDSRNTSVLKPLNPDLCLMYNLEIQGNCKQGYVSVYSLESSKEIRFHHHEAVNMSEANNKLFVMKYLKWDSKTSSHVGLVIGVLPAGDTIEYGMGILNKDYGASYLFNEATVSEVDMLYPKGCGVPSSMFVGREDLRKKLTLTVVPPMADVIELAMSIEELSEGEFLLGVHITDVASFVKIGSSLDREASQRLVSKKPAGQQAFGLFPENVLSLCTLNPQEDHPVVSVLLTIDYNGHINNAKCQKSIINCNESLTYDKVEGVIMGDTQSFPADVTHSIQMIYHIVKMARKLRLGNGYLYHPLSLETVSAPETGLLMEELQIMVNEQVANILVSKFPDCTPLLRQLLPDQQALTEWKERYSKHGKNSVVLSRFFMASGNVCNCTGPCVCIDRSLGKEVKALDYVDIQTSVWGDLLQYLELGNIQYLCNYIVGVENHPQLAIALHQLKEIMPKPSFVCSGATSMNHLFHNGLGIALYTQCISPLQSYVDLVAQQLLVASLDQQSCPYSMEQIQSICKAYNYTLKRTTDYNQVTRSLQLAAAAKIKPLQFFPTINHIDEERSILHFPLFADVPDSQLELPIECLSVCGTVLNQDRGNVVIEWKERIYNTNADQPGRENISPVSLNPRKYITEIPSQDWQNILSAIITEDYQGVQDLMKAASHHARYPNLDESYASDVTSEMKPENRISQQYCNFSLKLSSFDVVKVQVVAKTINGLLMPSIQLFNLTPTFDLCVEHNSSPLQCFIKLQPAYAPSATYPDVVSYQKAWLPVINVETTYRALQCPNQAVIHNVKIVWESSESAIFGSFTLPLQFCKDRELMFSTDPNSEGWGSLQIPGVECFYDYLCIRYESVYVDLTPIDPNSMYQSLTDEPICWVGHCVTTRVVKDKEKGTVTVHLRLQQSAIKFPPGLLSQEGASVPCTVQWIQKPADKRQLELTIKELKKASSLTKNIGLGRRPEPVDVSDISVHIGVVLKLPIPSLDPPDSDHLQAIQASLKDPFTVVSGGPGTGKTVLAARLAYLSAELNKKRPLSVEEDAIKPQVLVCAPTEEALDTMTALVKKVNKTGLKVVRVYGEDIELTAFPVPGQVSSIRQASNITNYKEVALHHLIRKPTNSLCTQIRVLDMLFKEYPDDITDVQIEDYQEKHLSAELEELKQANIIICTPLTATSTKMKKGTNIQQLIFDDAHMCSDPETMAPLITTNPKQVTLIGDDQQLGPVVLEDIAKQCGLDKALISRHMERTMRLNTQYRMHPSLASFPSSNFYESSLQSDPAQNTLSSITIWPDAYNRAVFCHLIGREEKNPALKSVFNKEEAVESVRVASKFLSHSGVQACNVAILSFYPAQCGAVETELECKGLTGIAISTIINAQGKEWDYVIVSTVHSQDPGLINNQQSNEWKNFHLGELRSNSMVNVALTRARKGMIIIGNHCLLRCIPVWDKLLTQYNQANSVVNAGEFLP